MTQFHIKQLAIIGVGLIGGSLARALRRANAVDRITGVGRSETNLHRAVELGVIDDWTHDVRKAVKDANLVCVAVPMSMYDQVFSEMTDVLADSTVITDVGSTKQHAIDVAFRYLENPQNFVPSHPIAGTEKSGVEASFAELFDKHVCILTPLPATHASAIDVVINMWSQAGCSIVEMDAAKHDQVLASVSHLPHIAAFALVNAVRRQRDDTFNPFSLAAGGFRDFTRIASSSPEMWRDIALCNRDAMLQQIAALQGELKRMGMALEAGDGDLLLAEFRQAKQARDEWLAGHEDSRE